MRKSPLSGKFSHGGVKGISCLVKGTEGEDIGFFRLDCVQMGVDQVEAEKGRDTRNFECMQHFELISLSRIQRRDRRL